MLKLVPLLILLALPAAAKQPPSLTAEGTAYPITGNTLRLALEKGAMRELRLWGVALPDAPTNKIAARDKLDAMASGKRAACEERWTDGRQTDALCTVDGQDLGRELIAAGLALVDRRDIAGKPEWQAYHEAENAARLAKLGVWAEGSEPKPEPPILTGEVQAPAAGELDWFDSLAEWLHRWQILLAGFLVFMGGAMAYLAARRYARERRAVYGGRRRAP
jgi:endonuclease YncB( thermonuclease family)